MEGEEATDDLLGELRQWVRKEIGPIATPDFIQWAPGLPKTRSGKIMRRILRSLGRCRCCLTCLWRYLVNAVHLDI
jgi:acetyl-CoA synthetase